MSPKDSLHTVAFCNILLLPICDLTTKGSLLRHTRLETLILRVFKGILPLVSPSWQRIFRCQPFDYKPGEAKSEPTMCLEGLQFIPSRGESTTTAIFFFFFFNQINLIACINCLAFLAATSLVSICWLLGAAAAYLGVGVRLVLGGGAGLLVERVHQPQVLLVQLMAVHRDGSLN